MRTLTALALGAALATPALATIVPANAFNDRLMKLSPAERNAVLRQAVTKDSQRCGRLSNGTYHGTYKNLAFWTAKCTPGGTYEIFIGGNGQAQVRSCADAKALGLPACGKVD